MRTRNVNVRKSSIAHLRRPLSLRWSADGCTYRTHMLQNAGGPPGGEKTIGGSWSIIARSWSILTRGPERHHEVLGTHHRGPKHQHQRLEHYRKRLECHHRHQWHILFRPESHLPASPRGVAPSASAGVPPDALHFVTASTRSNPSVEKAFEHAHQGRIGGKPPTKT